MTLLNACPTCQLLFTTWITTCPECERVLERVVEEDKAATLSELISRFLDHRPTSRGWATGGVVRPERRDKR